jgi:hypothetical protein
MCLTCGEEIMNEREVIVDARIVRRTCAASATTVRSGANYRGMEWAPRGRGWLTNNSAEVAGVAVDSVRKKRGGFPTSVGFDFARRVV